MMKNLGIALSLAILVHDGPVVAAPFLAGACTHFSQGKGDINANMAAIQAAGLLSIRDEAGWGAVERRKGELIMPERYTAYVRAARAAGLETLMIFDYANPFYDDGDRPRSSEAIEGFCRYAEFLVREFGKDVRLYEVWNEWDIGIGLPERHRRGGTAEDYIRLLKAVYPRVKAVDPGIIVMAGGCTSGAVKKGWLEEIVRLGALEFSDAISIHSYNYSAGFPERSPEACAAWMTDVQSMLRRYNEGKEVPFYVTEMGWPTHLGKAGTSPELSASYLARLYLLARSSPTFRGLWWYDFQDDGWNPAYNEDNFGLVRPDLTPKPAYHVLAGLSDLIANGTFVDRLGTTEEALWVVRFKDGGKDVWALWSGDDQDRQIVLRNSDSSGEVEVQQVGHPGMKRSWGHRPWAEGRNAETQPESLSLVAGARPVLVRGELSGVHIEAVKARFRTEP